MNILYHVKGVRKKRGEGLQHITFENIHVLGSVIHEEDTYIQYEHKDMFYRYDSNFIRFKQMPSLLTFQKLVATSKKYNESNGAHYVHFHFPENVELPTGLCRYLQDEQYEITKIELYAIQPIDFPIVEQTAEIEIQAVNEENLQTFLRLQYEDDIEFGPTFAKEQRDLTYRLWESGVHTYVIAYFAGKAVGYVELIVQEETVEINNLMVRAPYRRRSIGSMLQTYVMQTFPNKTIILLADSEDTPREMYQKQGYVNCGFMYEALKIFKYD